MILEILVVAAGVAAGGAVGMWLRRRRRAAAAAAPASRPRAEGDVRVGDVVLHLGEDHIVVAETRFEEESIRFVVHTVEVEDRTRFVLGEEGPPRRTAWLVPEEPPVAGPPPDRARHRGTELRLVRRGRSVAATEGGESQLPTGSVEYARYGGPGRAVMLVLVSGETTLWLVGEEVLPGMLEVLPGS